MSNPDTLPRLRAACLSLLAILVIFASGCGPAPTPIIINLPTATKASSSPAESPTPQLLETLVPTITPTPFVPKAVIKIFANVPLSGDRANAGQEILLGAELAVQQLHGPLMASGYQVELVRYDDQNLMEPALANAQAIVAEPEILCGVGHYDSDITIAASDIYHRAGLAFLTPSAGAPLLTDRNYLEVNRLIGRSDGQGTAAAEFTRLQGYGSVFIISPRSAISLRNAEYFRSNVGLQGVKWLGSVISDVTDENRAQVVNRIINAQPEVVYFSSSANQAIPVMTALRAMGYQGAFLGTERLDSRSALTVADPSVVADGGLYYTLTSVSAQYLPGAVQFVQDFKSMYGSSPRSYAAHAYDAAGICLKAIEEASLAKGGELPDRGEVARTLRALQEYPGITGTYSFNRKGDPNPVQYFVYQVVSVDASAWDQNPIVASVEVSPP